MTNVNYLILLGNIKDYLIFNGKQKLQKYLKLIGLFCYFSNKRRNKALMTMIRAFLRFINLM